MEDDLVQILRAVVANWPREDFGDQPHVYMVIGSSVNVASALYHEGLDHGLAELLCLAFLFASVKAQASSPEEMEALIHSVGGIDGDG